jgi:predicted transcriptional regulator
MIDRLKRELDLVERHLQILGLVIANEPIGIVNLSNASDYPKYKVRYSLRVLEEASLVEPTSQGAVTTDRAGEFVTDLDEQLTASIERLDGLKPETTAPIDS